MYVLLEQLNEARRKNHLQFLALQPKLSFKYKPAGAAGEFSSPCQLSVLTLSSVSVPPPCYRSKKILSRRSCRNSNPRPFNHESVALSTELSPPPILVREAEKVSEMPTKHCLLGTCRSDRSFLMASVLCRLPNQRERLKRAFVGSAKPAGVPTASQLLLQAVGISHT